jgi:hypothetical protein
MDGQYGVRDDPSLVACIQLSRPAERSPVMCIIAILVRTPHAWSTAPTAALRIDDADPVHVIHRAA